VIKTKLRVAVTPVERVMTRSTGVTA